MLEGTCGQILIYGLILVCSSRHSFCSVVLADNFGRPTSLQAFELDEPQHVFEGEETMASREQSKETNSAYQARENKKKDDEPIDWSHKDQNQWARKYPQCRGLRQSPIDILTEKVVFNGNLSLELVDYDQEVEFEIKNTYHSVSLKPMPLISTPKVRLNFVPGGSEFDLQEIHFHWGDGLAKGSEHEIDGKRAAAEMHMVHYKSGIDVSQVGTEENSVVVIGVLIESDLIEHNKLEPIVSKTEHVNGTDLKYKDNSPISLISMLPENHYGFYTYNGSLTTPPCFEVVTWVLMSEPVYMSQDKLVELSNIEAQVPELGRRKIEPNCRDVQPLRDRCVHASFNTTDISAYTKLDSFEKQQAHFDKSGLVNEQMNTNERLSYAMQSYWRAVNTLRSCIRNAYGKIDEARKELLQKIFRHSWSEDEEAKRVIDKL